MTQPRRAPGDGRVVLLIVLLVIAVLALNLLSALVPQLDVVLGSAPIVVVGLVAGTGLILLRLLLRKD
jgi:hypothetical protein